WGIRNAEEIRIELIPNSAFRIFFAACVFNRFTPLRRLAIKNGVEQGHGTQPNRSGIKDLWPSASRFWHLIKPGSETVNNPDPESFRPKIRGQEPKTLSKRAHNPLLKEAGLTKPTAAHPSGGPVAGGAIGISGMPLTASGRERPPHSHASRHQEVGCHRGKLRLRDNRRS